MVADKVGISLAGADALPASDHVPPAPPDAPSALADAALLVAGVTLLARDGAFLVAEAALPARNGAFLVAGVAFLARDGAFLVAEAALLARDGAFLVAGAALLARNEPYVRAKMAFAGVKTSKTPVFAVSKDAAAQKATVSSGSTPDCSPNPDWFHARPHPGPLLQGEGETFPAS
jgi:hypothetical protein